MKHCSKCQEYKDESEFNVTDPKTGRLHSYCRTCRAIIAKNYYEKHREERIKCSRQWKHNNPEKYKEQLLRNNQRKQLRRDTDRNYKEDINKQVKKRMQEIRKQFLDMYGNKCECCGETIYEFLSIEHKLGQKGIKDKEVYSRAYKNAIKEYRPDIYGILCMNCNLAKGRFGYCPHEKISKA